MLDFTRLKELQALPLERKIGFTAARIAEFYKAMNGKVYVSFSGGKDSTVLLYIARKLFPDIRACFADTGLEYPEIREFVKTFPNVDFVRPEMPFNKVIEKYGYPVISKEVAQRIYEYRKKPEGVAACYLGFKKWEDTQFKKSSTAHDRWAFLVDAPFKISHKCCHEMKKKPLHRYHKETGLFPIVATMAEESFRRKIAWGMYGCNVLTGENPRSAPMSFWTEQDVLTYLQTMKIPIASVYGDIVQTTDGGGLTTSGCKRTGCMFCMFGVQLDKEPNRFQRMYYTHPKQWDYCINHLGVGKVLDYIGVPYEPEQDLFSNPDLKNNHNPQGEIQNDETRTT